MCIRDSGRDSRHTWDSMGDPSELEIFEYDVDGTEDQLHTYCENADFVFNFAGVNRPDNPEMCISDRPQSVKEGESAIRKTKKAEAGYRSVFARTCDSQTHLIGEK